LGYLCNVARDNSDQWLKWVAELVEDEDDRSQVVKVILARMQSEEDQRAKFLQKIKTRFNQVGEKAFLEEFKEQTGKDLPDEFLEYLRSEK
jgi:predicted metal-dependent RNase